MGSTDLTAGEWLVIEAIASDAERFARLHAAIQTGLAAGERVVVVTGSEEPSELEASLAGLEGFDEAITRGALLVAPPSVVREEGRPRDPTGIAARLLSEAIAAGYRGVRLILDPRDARDA